MIQQGDDCQTATLPQFGDISPFFVESFIYFSISSHVITLSRRVNPHPAKNNTRGSGGFLDRHNCCGEVSNGFRTSPMTSKKFGKRSAHLGHTAGPKTHVTHYFLLINADDRRGTIFLVLSILMIRDELVTNPSAQK